MRNLKDFEVVAENHEIDRFRRNFTSWPINESVTKMTYSLLKNRIFKGLQATVGIMLAGSCTVNEVSIKKLDSKGLELCLFTEISSNKERVRINDAVDQLIDSGRYNDAAKCLQHEIDKGYGTPYSYSDLSIYLAKAGRCVEAETAAEEYQKHLEDSFKNTFASGNEVIDPIKENIIRELETCKSRE